MEAGTGSSTPWERISLYDLSFLASKDEDILRNTFDTLPMAVLELSADGSALQYVRSNESFQDFIFKMLGHNLSDRMKEYAVPMGGEGSVFMKKVRQCCLDGDRTFIEEKREDGYMIHSFARRVGVNPVNGKYAVAVVVLSITEPNDGQTYAGIARALASDYHRIYYVDLKTEDYIEFSSPEEDGEIAVEGRGRDFFQAARNDVSARVYEKDREALLGVFSKENVVRELAERGSLALTYRLVDTGVPVYARMKITGMGRDGGEIIIGVSIIDEQMKRLEEENRLRQEKIALGRIAALSGKYIVLYTVEPLTGHYIQYSPSSEYESFGLARQGDDFFSDVKRDAPIAIAPEDMERHLRVMTKENMLREIREAGMFVHHYGLLMGGGLIPVSLRATLIREEGEEKLILGVIKA